MTARFTIGGEIYELAEPDHVSLRTFIGLSTDPACAVIDLSVANFERLVDEFRKLQGKPAGAFLEHPDRLQILAVIIWLGMVKKRQDAGDYSYLPFTAALDAPLDTFDVLPPEPGKGEPRKGRKKR